MNMYEEDAAAGRADISGNNHVVDLLGLLLLLFLFRHFLLLLNNLRDLVIPDRKDTQASRGRRNTMESARKIRGEFSVPTENPRKNCNKFS